MKTPARPIPDRSTLRKLAGEAGHGYIHRRDYETLDSPIAQAISRTSVAAAITKVVIPLSLNSAAATTMLGDRIRSVDAP